MTSPSPKNLKTKSVVIDTNEDSSPEISSMNAKEENPPTQRISPIPKPIQIKETPDLTEAQEITRNSSKKSFPLSAKAETQHKPPQVPLISL